MVRIANLVVVLFLLAAFSATAQEQPSVAVGAESATQVLKVTSTAFEPGGDIPKRYTCDGVDVSPPLKWGKAPPECKSVAIIADDPDAPVGTWVHWVIFNLPPTAGEVPEGVAKEKVLVGGIRQGKNDFGRIGYGGPCPPPGNAHRYFFKVYVLDTLLDLPAGATKQQLLAAMEGHIVAQGQLMGKYSRM